MHRGSSKGARAVPGAPEILPLSASPRPFSIRVELTRASGITRRRITVRPGESVKQVLRRLGEAPEGSAVLIDDLPIPLDTPLVRPVRLVVLPTFSGG